MGDAMVSARMSQAKKDAGNRVLAKMGMSASQFVNSAYDYLIQHGASPFTQAEDEGARQIATAESITWALAQIDDMSLPFDNRFATMGDDDIRRERLARHGLDSR